MIFKPSTLFRFKNYRLSSKLILVYVLLSVIPMSLLGLFSYWQYEKSIEEQIGEYMPRFLMQANANITKHMEDFAELDTLMFNSDNMLAILRRDSYQSRSKLNQDQYDVNNYLARTYLNTGNPDILGVFLFSKNRFFYSARSKFAGLGADDALIPYGQDLNLTGKAKIILPSQINLVFENNEPYVLIMKQMNDVDNRKSLATMLIAVKLSFINNVLRDFEQNNTADLWLMNREGEIIFHTDEEKIGDFDTEINRYPILNGSFRKGSGNKAVIVSLSESLDFNWVLAHSIPLKNLTERTDLVRNVTIFVFICFVLMTSVLFIFFAMKVTRPIKKLSRLMKEVEMGRFQVDLQINSSDEVGTLARSFNSMVATIHELIETNFDIKIRQKEAELYALQSQINPHFMYNTLETINMAVEEGRSEMVVEMVTLLGRMLRFSVSNKNKYVPIADEVQHISNFLTIQKYRFTDRLLFEIDKKTDIDSYFTPKFILQPVIENAIKYGLETRKVLDIKLSISREFGAHSGEEDIVFRIRDNGPGIEQERLEEIERMLRSETLVGKDSGFGLGNVNARIVIMLGEEYGLQLHSIHGKGTEVMIRIPVINKEE
ncbi:sensor histidine kinase [Paenibacillus herberti]|uniref:histidine kinase n=1 Tax=Paenibacillus herberti TaxID=1619309 RepID=A0A229P1N9_9BACL|nr:sensor histidine kinase [Paenibacillus herberti]OXM15874.1 sensor histidine kinase [Paenibacillus herberti]